MNTYGPTFEPAIDGKRIDKQREIIKHYMLFLGAIVGEPWHTLAEISKYTRYPEASVSAQLRHLRKKRFGGYIVPKRRRNGKGTWEYRVLEPDTDPQMELNL